MSRKRARPSKSRTLPRSQTWSGDTSQLSDAPTPAGEDTGPRSGTGQSRKKNIQLKAAHSIAAGIMPTFCNNCGEIETPTWRKAYARTEFGDPNDISLASASKEGIVGFEPLEPAKEHGEPCKYRIFKQSVSVNEKDPQGFEALNLCNPCGLWFNKRGGMRPPEVWMKQSGDPSISQPKKKRKQSARTAQKKSSGQDVPTSDAIQEPYSTGFTDPMMHSDAARAFPFPRYQDPNCRNSEDTNAASNHGPHSLAQWGYAWFHEI